MKKTIEDAAREYSKSKGFSANKDTYHGEGFIAGDAHGYARAIEESAEGFEEKVKELTNELLVFSNVLDKAGNELFMQEGKIKELEANIAGIDNELNFEISANGKMLDKIKELEAIIFSSQKELAEKDERIKNLEDFYGQESLDHFETRKNLAINRSEK